MGRLKDSDIKMDEIPELEGSFFRDAQLRLPTPKKAVSIRLDQEVIDWFKEQGSGYQTKINAILKMYVAAHK